MKKLGLAAIAIIAVLIASKTKLSSEPLENSPSAQINEISISPKPVDQPQEKPVEKSVEIPKLPEHLRKQGYEIDPANPAQAILKFTKNGKAATSIVELSRFEPRYTTSEDALNMLEGKKTDDPETEMSGMHPVDFNSDSSMLLGYFHDKKLDIELVISLDADDDSENVCLSFPEKTFKLPDAYVLRADASGYGVVKFNENEYLRLIWATDQNRVIHAQFLQRKDGEFTITKSFAAVEVNRKKSETLKRCP